MMLDINRTNSSDLWMEFKQVLCSPYQNNLEHLQHIESWFGTLYARHAIDGLQLTKNWAERRDQPGQGITLYSLCNQLHFTTSDWALMLSAPYKAPAVTDADQPRDTVQCHQIAGIWIHDYGRPDFIQRAAGHVDLLKARLSRSFVHTKARKIPSASLHQLIEDINVRANNFDPSGKSANTVRLGGISTAPEIRASIHSPSAVSPHTDQGKCLTSENMWWNRTFLNAFRGVGTIYHIGPNQVPVAAPPHMISSHIGVGAPDKTQDVWGITHRAGNTERLVLKLTTERIPIARAVLPPFLIRPFAQVFSARF